MSNTSDRFLESLYFDDTYKKQNINNSFTEIDSSLDWTVIVQDHEEDLSTIRSSCLRYIYHISIIDYLQRYNFGKKAERFAKSALIAVKGKPNQHRDLMSCMDPKRYKERFNRFCSETVFSNIVWTL